MTVRWVVNETRFTAGLSLVAGGGLTLIASGFLRVLLVAAAGTALILAGCLLVAVAVRPLRVPKFVLLWPERDARSPFPTHSEETPEVIGAGSGVPVVLEPVETLTVRLASVRAELPTIPRPGVAAAPLSSDPPSAVPDTPPPLVPEEAPWPPRTPVRPEGPAPDPAPSAPWSEDSLGVPLPALAAMAPGEGQGEMPSVSPLGPGPSSSVELHEPPPAGPSSSGGGPEPLAEPDASPVVRWAGPSLPFAAATDRSQAIRGGGFGVTETWPPILDRSEEDLRLEVERLRQQVEALSPPVLVPGFTVLPSPAARDALGLVTRVPEPPVIGPRTTALCTACGDADLTGPSGGNRCWGCGRAVCGTCFWRYGPGPALHRCPSCAGKSSEFTISGGRRSLATGSPASVAEDPDWSEGL